MDYNRVVKVVETLQKCNRKNASRIIQKFNATRQVVEELQYRYDFTDGAEFLYQKAILRYTDAGKIESKYQFTGHYPSITGMGYGTRDLEKTIKYEYDADGRVIKVYEEGDNEYSEGRSEYITAFEYLKDGTKIGRKSLAEFFNDPSASRTFTVEYYDKAGHLTMEDGGRLKKFWTYDEAGNVTEESWEYEEPFMEYIVGVKFPVFRKEYDERGNEIALYHFKRQSEEVSREYHSVFNEQNQMIQSSTIDHERPERNHTCTYEYEVVIRDVDPNMIDELDSRITQSEQVELLEKAIQNDADAMALVASNYYSGKDGFPRDDDRALYWSKKATDADSDYDFPWELLGRCYEFGVGTEKNVPKAIAALRKSIELGNTSVLYHLAELLYFDGNEGEKAECLSLLEKAVTNQDEAAEALLGSIYLNGELQTNNRQRGVELLTRSAEHGDSQGAHILAEAYLHQVDGSEHVVPYDLKKAVKYFAVAVENGEDRHKALYYAGLAFFYGEGVPKNTEKARKCLEELIDDVCLPGEKVFDILGCMCFEGEGGPVDYTLGEKALRRAIGSDDTEISLEAMNNLGMYLYTLTNRMSEAIELLQSAANQGNANAQVNLGKAYFDGKGVSRDVEIAAHYFRLAAEQGNQIAIDNLKVIQLSNNSSSYSPTKKRHPIRGAIVGGVIGIIISLIIGPDTFLANVVELLGIVVGLILGWRGSAD